MKNIKNIISMMVITILLVSASAVYADLHDRGGGLIYDDVLNVTWLQHANYGIVELSDTRVNEIITAVGSIDGHTLVMDDFKDGGNYTGKMTWWGAMAWADQLVYQGYDNWRLPHILPVNGVSYNFNSSYDGSADNGYNISAPNSEYPGSTGSEIAFMFYNNLMNKGMYDVDGNSPQPDWGLKNIGPFIGLTIPPPPIPIFWTSLDYGAPGPDWAWAFNFHSGFQNSATKVNGYYAWAVRDGDVEPIPISIDIIPKTCPNECPIKGGGSIEIAIHGTADFDVNDIDIASIRLEEVAPTRSSLKDKSTPVSTGGECPCTTDGRDGFIDLCLKFDKKAIFEALGGVTVEEQDIELTLEGRLDDGISIEGKDCINIVKKAGKGKKD